MPYQFNDNENHKIPLQKLWIFLAGLSLFLSGFDIIYGKYTIYDLAAIPMSIFGIYCLQFHGWVKIEKKLMEWNWKRKSSSWR